MDLVCTSQQSSRRQLIKRMVLFFSLIISSQLFAQKVEKYIEVWQRVNFVGLTRIEGATYPENKNGNEDTLINTAKIKEIIRMAKNNNKQAIWVINELSKEGWSLVSSVFVPSSDNSGYTSYYFKKSFDKL